MSVLGGENWSIWVCCQQQMELSLDDELQLLQRELMAVQQQKTNPLSERTVAEIMVKLHHEGFAFIPTSDGTEYVTPLKIEQEISSLVRQRNKISLTIIPQLLNISQEVVEGRLNQLLRQWPLTRHANNLYSHKYFDSLLASIAQLLKQHGRIDLQTLAIEHELKIEFLQQLVGQNLSKLQAQVDGRLLITQDYTLLQQGKILGFLSGVRKPLQVQVLYKSIEAQPRTAEKLILDLIADGKLKGRLSNGYYIPAVFIASQKKTISQFLQQNGYLDTQMIRKKFLVAKPEEWITTNLGSDFIRIDSVYFLEPTLENLALQLNSQLKAEGYAELSHILPVDLSEAALQTLLEERCGLKDYFLCEGYVYAQEWLERLAEEFKPKILHSIFFKKEPKTKDSKKKGNKKEKEELVTEEELREVLFNGGFADYSMAEVLAPELLDLVRSRLEDLRKSTQKDLSSTKGIITSAFLKFKSCKTILRNEESLTRTLNLIQKQNKKGERWTDPDFGPSPQDPKGTYSLLFYDNLLPKGWPAPQLINWKEVAPGELLKSQPGPNQWPMKRCQLVPVCHLLAFHNQREGFKLPLPPLQPLQQDASSPFVFRFFVKQKEERLVLVDGLLPFWEEGPLCSLGPLSLLEKAYAKLRYCYKGTLNAGIQQLLLEATGRSCRRLVLDTQQDKDEALQLLPQALARGDFILVLAEGEADKPLVLEEKEVELVSLQPYYLHGVPEEPQVYPSNLRLPVQAIPVLFRNVFLIAE